MSFLSGDILFQALKDALKKFHPRSMVKNPVMFVVAVGSVITTVIVAGDIIRRPYFILQYSGNDLALVYRAVC